MTIDLSETTALVTGSSRGIGKALARQLAESGARVGIHYNHRRDAANELAREFGNQSIAFKADLSNTVEVQELFDDVITEFGHLDLLVNNAGFSISSDPNKDDKSWLEDLDKTLSVNLTAPALLCKKAINHFINRKGGRIINISSRAAFRGDTAEYMAYAASKAGLVALTRSIARAYGKQGIKAFDIAPGFTRTDMAREFMDQYGDDYALDDISLNRLTEPEDIAPIVALLASGLADHATGTTIDINAGSYMH